MTFCDWKNCVCYKCKFCFTFFLDNLVFAVKWQKPNGNMEQEYIQILIGLLNECQHRHQSLKNNKYSIISCNTHFFIIEKYICQCSLVYTHKFNVVVGSFFPLILAYSLTLFFQRKVLKLLIDLLQNAYKLMLVYKAYVLKFIVTLVAPFFFLKIYYKNTTQQNIKYTLTCVLRTPFNKSLLNMKELLLMIVLRV